MKYTLTIETISPLHIGTGTILLKDFDYVSTQDKTYVINQDAVYSAEFDQRGGEARLSLPPSRLVSADRWQEDSPLVRYTLQGGTTIEQLHEQIKDVHGRCYLPGSSLKGALRTSLLAYATLSGNLKNVQVNYRENKRGNFIKESAAQNFEQALLRPAKDDPNHDLLRALHVFDSLPIPVRPSKLMLCAARVFTGGEPGSPVVVEAVQRGSIFEAEIMIDELALQYARKLGWEDSSLWLANLIPILQEVSRRRIQQELQATREKSFAATEKFYTQLERLAQKLTGSNSAVIQMGWGTGWNGMTIGPWLSKAAQDEARQKFQLGRPPGKTGSWEPDLSKPFPKSRRLRAIGDAPGMPFGWLAITFEPCGEPSQAWQELTQKATAQVLSTSSSSPVKAELPPSQTPSAPAPQAAPPTPASTPTPQAAPAPARAARPVESKRPLVASFSALPKPGDRFRGSVWFTDSDGTLFVEIPGLPADDLAPGLIGRKDRSAKKYKDGETVICAVVAVEKDPDQPGHWLVRCVLD